MKLQVHKAVGPWGRAWITAVVIHGLALLAPIIAAEPKSRNASLRPLSIQVAALSRPEPRPVPVPPPPEKVASRARSSKPRSPRSERSTRKARPRKGKTIRKPRPPKPSPKEAAPSQAEVRQSGVLRADAQQLPRALPELKHLPPGISRATSAPKAEARAEATRPKGLRRRRGGGYILNEGEFTAHITPDGGFYFEDHDLQATQMARVFLFDVTDTVMRALKDDPYLKRKMAFVQESAELRARLRKRVLERDLERSVIELRARLEALWKRPSLAYTDKRQVILDIWDGVAETGDPRRVRAGRRVRITLLGFVRRRLPAHSKHRFTRRELARFEAVRTASVAFQPYP